MSHSAIATSGTFRATDSVRVRSEPSTDASIVTVIHSGESVEVLNHDPSGWSSVQVGDKSGFVRSDFLMLPTGSGTVAFRTTDGVNLRASASTNSSVLQTIIAGTNVEVLEHDPAGWSRVRVNGTTGFIRSDYLTRGGTSAAASASSQTSASSSQAIASLRTSGTVNLRASSSTNSDVIRTLSAGTSVDVLDNQSNGWSKVRHNGNEGFIRSDLLTSSSVSQSTTTLRTTTGVNFRSGPSTNHDRISLIPINTSVEVLESQSNGWSKVRHNGAEGFIRSDLLSNSTASQTKTLSTVTGVNLRSGPSTEHSRIRLIPVNTPVDVLENLSNGWSKVRHEGTEGFIRSDLLGSGVKTIELIDWSTARSIVPRNRDIRITDVRTGVSYNIRVFSIGNHADFDTSTQADTDAKLGTRNGTWSWAARPVWVTIGDRTFAASVNGMPHAGSVVSGNGLSGHFCLHFKGSTSTGSTSASYIRDMQNGVTEAWNARPQ